MTERERLAQYQRELLDALHRSNNVEEAKQLVSDVAEKNGQDAAFSDPRMLDAAMELTKKWGVKHPE